MNAVIDGGAFTSKSDVYSFAITMWEIFSLGKGTMRVHLQLTSAAPFQWLSNKEAWIEIPRGERLPRPDNIPDKLWKLMNRCWDGNPEQRPTFVQVG
jgi:hypothetical protein